MFLSHGCVIRCFFDNPALFFSKPIMRRYNKKINVTIGHSRQGWKCRLCKINVHGDCRSGVSRCLPKSRLLRRQKSSSELDSSMISDNLPDDDLVSNAEEIDQTYSVLKQVIFFFSFLIYDYVQ